MYTIYITYTYRMLLRNNAYILKLIPLFASFLLLLSSCANYLPVSEGIIYHDQDKEPYLAEGILIPHGDFTATSSYIMLPKTLRNNVRDKYEEDTFGNDGIHFREPLILTLPITSISFPLAYKAAIGININPLYPGLDGTVHLFEDVWLTGSLQFPALQSTDAEFILQRPVYRMRNGGVSVGFFYRNESLRFYRDGDPNPLLDFIPAHFPVKWYGPRITAQIPDDFPSQNRLKFHFNAGYSSRYNSMLFSIGIGFSSRPSPRKKYPAPLNYGF